MAAADFLAQARAAWRWIVTVLVVLFVFVALGWAAWNYRVRAIQAEQNLRAEVQRQAGEDRARRIGIPVVYQRPQAEVDAAAERAKRENPVLRAQLERAEKELGKLRLELVAHVETPGAPALIDVLRGTPLKLGGDLAVARDDSGAHTLHGSLWARLADGTLVTKQPYSQPVTWATETAETSPPAAPERWWRLGPLVGMTEDGWRDGWRAGAVATARFGRLPLLVLTAKAGPKRFEDGKRGVGGDLAIGGAF